MKNTVPFTVVIITQNSVELIENAIKSAKFADEVLIIDSNSTDGTQDLAKKLEVKVINNTFENYAKQKQFGIDSAQNDWVFILDSDERISKQLAQSVLNALYNETYSAYMVDRKNFFLGKEVMAGFWQDDTHIRFFNRQKYKLLDQQIHETVIPKNSEESSVGNLEGELYHISHRSVEELSKKAYEYSILDAQERIKRNPSKITGKNIVFSALTYFFKIFIQGGGYKDGTQGLINSLILTYQQRILIRSLIWEMQQNPSLKTLNKNIDKKLSQNFYDGK